MNCNCAKEISQKFKEVHRPTAESVEIMNRELISGRLFGVVEVRLPNKKKPENVNLLYSYCPFCGKKYNETQKD